MKLSPLLTRLMLLALGFAVPQPTIACTDFALKTTDNAVICGRSMEWGQPMNAQLRFHGRQESVQSTAPSGKPGASWRSKYGYAAADCYGIDTAVDGMNEQGLVFSALWLPGTVYQKVPAGADASAINMLDLGKFVLGTCANVDEAVGEILRHYVWCAERAEIGGVPTLHIALHDAAGNHKVIEFVDGQQKIYDNPNSVLTNAPTYDWHITNLRNYIHVDASNQPPVTVAGTVLEPPGQGSGFLGVPGDWTPPSRFVRATAMRAFAQKPSNATDGAILAAHILNAVDIPIGAIREKVNGVNNTDYTQWIIIKDLTNKKLYYRGYKNLAPKTIDFAKIDWTSKVPSEQLPLDGP